MPRVLRARHPTDSAEERWLRKLTRSKRAPAEQVLRARTIVMSWDGADTATIAASLGCHPQTVRLRIAQFNAEGAQRVVTAGGGGRRPRLTASQRQELVAMVVRLAGGQRPHVDSSTAHSGNGTISVRCPAMVSLDSLVAAANRRGIEIRRSQLRRVLLAAGLRWDPIHSWVPGHAPFHQHVQPAQSGQQRRPHGD
jgi:transposase